MMMPPSPVADSEWRWDGDLELEEDFLASSPLSDVAIPSEKLITPNLDDCCVVLEEREMLQPSPPSPSSVAHSSSKKDTGTRSGKTGKSPTKKRSRRVCFPSVPLDDPLDDVMGLSLADISAACSPEAGSQQLPSPPSSAPSTRSPADVVSLASTSPLSHPSGPSTDAAAPAPSRKRSRTSSDASRSTTRSVRFAEDTKTHDGLQSSHELLDALVWAFCSTASIVSAETLLQFVDARGGRQELSALSQLVSDLIARLSAAKDITVSVLPGGGGRAIRVGSAQLRPLSMLKTLLHRVVVAVALADAKRKELAAAALRPSSLAAAAASAPFFANAAP